MRWLIEEATQAAKETAGMNSGEAKGKAQEMAGEAKGMLFYSTQRW